MFCRARHPAADLPTSSRTCWARPWACRSSRSRRCGSRSRPRSSRRRRRTSSAVRWPPSAMSAPSTSSSRRWSSAWWRAAMTAPSPSTASRRSRASASTASRKAMPPPSRASSGSRPGSNATIRPSSPAASSTPSRWASTPRPRSCGMRTIIRSRSARSTSTRAPGTARWSSGRTAPWRCGWASARSTASARTGQEGSSRRARAAFRTWRPCIAARACRVPPPGAWPRPTRWARSTSAGGRACGPQVLSPAAGRCRSSRPPIPTRRAGKPCQHCPRCRLRRR